MAKKKPSNTTPEPSRRYRGRRGGPSNPNPTRGMVRAGGGTKGPWIEARIVIQENSRP